MKAGVTTTLWLQNAAFVFVPFIVASAFAAWFGMNDIATMKASFADQSAIFRRTHDWIMCWLHTGTIGSFIGFSAAFPLLSKILYPEVNALRYAMIPAIMRKEVARLEPGMSTAGLVRQSGKASAAIIGFSAAVAAHGAFFIPESFGISIALTGGAAVAPYVFLAFYGDAQR